MYAKAVLGLLPRSRPAELPSTVLTTAITVDRAHLARYNEVCGFRHGDILPATYPHVLGFAAMMRLMTGWDFPFPVVGLVHIANRITQVRPIRADEPLELSVHAADLRPHRRGRQFDIVMTGTVDGEEVWREVSTNLRRGSSPSTVSAGGDASTESESERGSERELPAAQAFWRVARSDADAYAEVSGDRNPIHTSYLGARLLGFPRPIAHGMWTKARLLAALAGHLPESFTVDVAFKAPILLPAKVGFAVPDGRDLIVFGKRPHLVGTLR
ncbi:acyl dehydratase [Allocatelliglobosispora scoriae]|uniref:Acyl dehydratase n=1 Tax=Allocatelliglobosispora scoriae TaxID=643052 RepID=A0A841BU06_9ACTN|nr:MaoC/PaaZ C-terminal domain-containing protein [Allocatelliglobosispora scoriae]MBB5870916.1 acyl dehydratase [Allocatelliglobosispora scoriae]